MRTILDSIGDDVDAALTWDWPGTRDVRHALIQLHEAAGRQYVRTPAPRTS